MLAVGTQTIVTPRRVLLGLMLIFVTLSLVASSEVEPPWIWLLAAVLMVVVGAGSTYVLPERVVESNPTVGLLPSLTVFVMLVLVNQPWFSDPGVRMAGAILGGVLLAFLLFARVLEPEDRYYLVARRAMLALSYLLAFGMYTVIYTTKVRSFYTATTITLMTLLVAFELYYNNEKDLRLVGLYTIATGLVLGQVTWVLNYWVIGGLTGGAFLLLVLYTCSGIIRAYLSGVLHSRLALEYISVMVIGFVAVAALVSSQPPL